MFCEKLCSLIIWFLRQIVSSSFCCDNINISIFSHIFHSFSKMALFINWNHFFFLRSVFILIYGFSQAFWLNLITLWAFLKTNPWFNAYFKFLMCITCLILSCKLATRLSTFSVFIFSGKNGKSLWRSCNFSRNEHQLQEKILYHFLHCSFLWNLH